MCPILDGYGVMGIFFNFRTRFCVNRVLWNWLARDVFDLETYRTRWNAGKLGWVRIRLASLMIQLLLRVHKPLSRYSFVKAWATF